MSNLIHCDGPGCDRTASEFDDQRLCEGPWIRVRSDGLPRLDFHSQACLGEWARQQPGNGSTTVVAVNGQAPCTCHRAADDPHTKAEHQAYPTTTTKVDGR